jgi:hypothetical protein
MAYLDETPKLDVRAVMALAMKGGKKSAYSITISCQPARSSAVTCAIAQTGLPR